MIIPIIQMIISGVLLGILYGLMGMGLALVWGVMDIVNLAHGVTMVLAGFIAYSIFVEYGLLSIYSAMFSAICMFGIGVFLWKFVIQPSIEASTVTLTLGIAMSIEAIMTAIWGAVRHAEIPTSFLLTFLPPSIQVGAWAIPTRRLEAAIVCAAISILMYTFLMKSHWGKEIRAVAQDRNTARLIGINIERIYVLAFAIGLAINGVVGAFLPIIQPLLPGSGALFLSKAFAVSILTWITGNIVWCVYGGIILALSENLLTLYISVGYKDLASTVMLLIALLLPAYIQRRIKKR